MDAERTARCTPYWGRQTGVQRRNSLDNAQAGVHGTPGIVFVSRGVAKIDEQSIAEVLGDMAAVVLDDLGRVSW